MAKQVDSTNIVTLLEALITKVRSFFWRKEETDSTPTSGSDHLVKSGGVYSSLQGIRQLKVLNLGDFFPTVTDNDNPVVLGETKSEAAAALNITEEQFDSLLNGEYDCIEYGVTELGEYKFYGVGYKVYSGLCEYMCSDSGPHYIQMPARFRISSVGAYLYKYERMGIRDVTVGGESVVANPGSRGVAVIPAIPDVSQFITRSVNDLVNYYLKSEVYTKEEVAALIGAIQQFHYEIAASTSAVTNPSNNVLYLIGPTGTGNDKYEEYVYTTEWVKIGDTSIDLSGYVTTQVLNNALASYATTASLAAVATSGSFNDLLDKPDIPAAQIQSDWDQTDNTAKDYIKNKPAIPTALADLATDATHRVVTDTEKATWNGKQDAIQSVEFIGSMYRTDVSGGGNVNIKNTTGQFPTVTNAGTYIVSVKMSSNTSDYSVRVTFGSNTYTLTSENGIIDDKRSLTVEAGSSWSASIVNSVASGTVLNARILKSASSVTEIGLVAVTNDYDDLDNKPDIPTALADLATDASHRTVTDAEKTAWNGKYTKPSTGIPASDLAAGVIPDVSSFITKSVNDLTNYYLKSETYTKAEVQGLIAAINQFHYEIYASTADVTSPANNVLYLIGPTGTGSDKYEEYVYSNGWVKIGDTSIDLSGYVTTQALNTALAGYVTSGALADTITNLHDVKYTAQTLTDAQKEQARTNIGATAPEIFWAEYGVTTFAEIEAAINANKKVLVKYIDRSGFFPIIQQFVLSNFMPQIMAQFFSEDCSKVLGVTQDLDTGDTQWQGPLESSVEFNTNKVTSWQTTPDDTHYPSEKLVKDSLDAKQPTINASNKLDYSLLSNTPTIPTTYAGSPTAGGFANKAVAIPFGSVDADSTATNIKATVDNFPTTLVDGVCAYIRNNVVGSASGFTLNINGTGAKPVYQTLADASRLSTVFNADSTHLFVYNSTRVEGGCWDLFYGFNSNDNTIGYNLRTNGASAPPAAQKYYRYRLLFTAANGNSLVPANTSSSTSATAAKTVNQTKIDPFGVIFYYSYTSAVNASASPSSAYLWMQYNNISLGYSFNRTGEALEMTARDPVYLKCAPQSDGSAIIDADNPIVQALPSSADGKIYIFLGYAESATAITLYYWHPVYYHDGTRVTAWPGVSVDDIKSSIGDIQAALDAIIGKSLISFTITNYGTYQAEEGMSWDEWVNSEYNTGGWVKTYDSSTQKYCIWHEGGREVTYENVWVSPNDIILNGVAYGTDNKIIEDD